MLVGVELVHSMSGDDVPFAFELTGGATVGARAAVAANGVHYRRLEAQGVDEPISAGREQQRVF